MEIFHCSQIHSLVLNLSYATHRETGHSSVEPFRSRQPRSLHTEGKAKMRGKERVAGELIVIALTENGGEM